MELRELKRHCERTISAAGPRFTPGVDPDAPNIRVAHLLEAIDALSLRDAFRDRVHQHESELADVARRHSDTLGELFARREVTPSLVADDLSSLRSATSPPDIRSHVLRIRRRSQLVSMRLEREGDTIYHSLAQEEDDQQAHSRLESRRQDIASVARAVDSVRGYFTDVPGRLLADNQVLLILGSWGTGKTHFMCDVARSALSDGCPVLLTLAHLLERDADPLDALAAWSGLAPDGETLLQELDALGKATGRRSLVLVDAINEGDREVWRRRIAGVVRRVRQHRNVGLALTCRTPFDNTILDEDSRSLFVVDHHVGFEEQEFDAQLEFFDYYSIPAPHVPLISQEFSRPLFLKILCEALARLARKSSRGAKLREIASGQKGMNYVLEYFVKKVGADIEDDFGLPKKSCWGILKGTPNTGFKGMAGQMADESRDWVTPADAAMEIQAKTGLSAERTRELRTRFVTDGLLAESAIYEGDGWLEILTFPYQRFGDHLIARHLLDRHLDTSSEEAVRRSFYSNRPLGKVFVLDHWNTEFQEPGLAAAIMLEFPERMKRSELGRELLWYLPRARRLVMPVKDALLEGLYWRSADSFTEETDRLVVFLLEFDDEDVRFDTLEVLTALAARHDHPYNAQRLSGYLVSMDMPERDLTWTEYIRTSGELGALRRVLAWVERRNHSNTPKDVAANDIELLSLGLTTTDRLLRDQLTKAIFEIGLRHPAILFEHVVVSFSFNDPYVPERMLAAAYGVAMRLWADPRGDALRSSIVPFARQLVRDLFLPDAPYRTAHTLMRGYALGAIELSRRISQHAIATQWVQYLRPPMSQLGSPFRESHEIADDVVEQAARALRMDFENYTIGRLIPGRGNYQMDHPEYKAVRRQILDRIRSLGYDPALFDQIDTNMARYSWRSDESGKTDRYGKKYSWIAYFEMYGWREHRGELPEQRQGERTSDCDVDPSFPSEAKRWDPGLPDLFSDAPEAPAEWLRDGPIPDYGSLLRHDTVDGERGPWVLLDGYVNQADGSLREVFTFLRCVLVDEGDLPALQQFIAQDSYLGNHDIPEPPSDFYTYLGEIPWSDTYGSELRSARGVTSQQYGYAFTRFEGGSWRPGVRVEVPVRRWAWESHHTQLVRTGSVDFPAPALAEALDLVNHNGPLDLYDAQGRLATIYRVWPDERGGSFDSHVLYIREDLITQYLEQTSQRFVWVPWGERTLHYEQFVRDLDPEVQAIFSQNRNDYGELVVGG